MEEALLYDINTRRSDDDLVGVCSTGKGKRTKRPRSQPQPSTISSASSVEVSGTTTDEEEEEDMANCLILLAQGRPLESPAEEEKFTSRRFRVAAVTTAGKAGLYVYQCKTCNKCFPSFQALGGHRTSHKKPKATPVRPADGKKPVVVQDDLQIGMNLFSKTVVAPGHGAGIGTCSKKAKVHVCSICGSEFSSGQALGGHMRRHRPLPAAAVSEVKKERRVLSLDLNLPAQSDDDLPRSPPTMAFFESNPPLVLSASVIVDCHN